MLTDEEGLPWMSGCKLVLAWVVVLDLASNLYYSCGVAGVLVHQHQLVRLVACVQVLACCQHVTLRLVLT